MQRTAQFDLETAIRLFYERVELSSEDIRNIFGGKISDSKIWSLKKAARAVSAKNGTPIFDARRVSTDDAFEAWGLDIADLERRFLRLRKLKISPAPPARDGSAAMRNET